MTTRRKKLTLRAYDYMQGQAIVVGRLRELGESGQLDRHELDRVSITVEVCAEQAVAPAVAEAAMRELALSIIQERNRTLFPAFDENDNLGDETMGKQDASEAAAA